MMRLTPSRLLTIIATVCWTGTRGAFAQTPTAADLLRAMAAAERTVQYSGVETATQGNLTTRMRIWRHGAQRRVEFLSPPLAAGDLLVNNGTEVWRYHRKDNTAVQAKSAPVLTDHIEQLTRNYQARVVSTQTVAGRLAWVVSLTGAGGTTRKFWIDKATRTRLRMERLSAAGVVVDDVALQDLHFGPVPASRFVWTAPPGAKVTQTTGILYSGVNGAQQAAPWMQYPHQLPPGYTFESAVIDAAKGEAWLRYTNGLNRFSVFQKRDTGAKDAGVTKLKDRDAWFWRRGGYQFLVVDVPMAQANVVTGSVR